MGLDWLVGHFFIGKHSVFNCCGLIMGVSIGNLMGLFLRMAKDWGEASPVAAKMKGAVDYAQDGALCRRGLLASLDSYL